MLKKELATRGNIQKQISRIAKSKALIKIRKLADHSKDPFFIAKEAAAYKTLQETPLPDFLIQK